MSRYKIASDGYARLHPKQDRLQPQLQQFSADRIYRAAQQATSRVVQYDVATKSRVAKDSEDCMAIFIDPVQYATYNISIAQISDWEDLQNKVALLFREINYIVETPKTVDLIRDKKEIDVFVIDPRSGLNQKIAIECKHWNSMIPKETVHGFRTVVGDGGFDVGIIISKSGFQAGAFAAAKYTNIRLMTFEQLQEALKKEWYEVNQKHLDTKTEKVRELYRLWLDYTSDLSYANSYIFTESVDTSLLYAANVWASDLMFSSRTKAESSTKGPKVSVYPRNLMVDFLKDSSTIAEGGHVVKDGFEINGDRHYFKTMCDSCDLFVSEFEKFLGHCTERFHGLSKEQQDKAFQRSLQKLKEHIGK